MVIKNAKLYKTVFNPLEVEDTELPQLAVSGRSNVGKSSLINALLGRKALARTSKSPGRTRSINYYMVGNKFYMVDLPGYGYARVSAKERMSWKRLVSAYFDKVSSLKGVLVLIDSKREMEEEEMLLIDIINQKGVKGVVVFTKVDRLKQRERAVGLAGRVGSSIELTGSEPILFSARTGEGKDKLIKRVLELVK